MTKGFPLAVIVPAPGPKGRTLGLDRIDLEPPVDGAADFLRIHEHPLPHFYEGKVAPRLPFGEEAFGRCLAASAEDGDSALFEADQCGG